jgi:hypothetical protein
MGEKSRMRVMDGGGKPPPVPTECTCTMCGAKMKMASGDVEKMVDEYERIFGPLTSINDVAIVCTKCRDKMSN